jgi:HSP20 family protein
VIEEMELIPWRPFRELARMEEEMSKLFDYFFGKRYIPARREEVWAPLADVQEKKDSFVVKVDLPEIDPKDVDISIEGRTLNIKGERKGEKEVSEEGYYFQERYVGKFQRTITLPDEVDAEKTKASYKDGVLAITIPKAKIVKAKKISIE